MDRNGLHRTLLLLFNIFTLTYSCDFESRCQWTMPKVSKRLPGFEIVKSYTGRPRLDQSRLEDGHFAVLSSSRVNVTAKLISPWYVESAGCVLSFYHHMGNPTVGSLVVNIATENGTQQVWIKAGGDNKPRWKKVTVPIGIQRRPFRLEFIGHRSENSKGHIAIDSITADRCTVLTPSQTPDNDVPEGGSCNFEKDLCGWESEALGHDEFKWMRHHGNTQTTKTGPSKDNTLGNTAGYYIYVDSSYGRLGDFSVLHSPVFSPPPRNVYDKNSPYYNMCQFDFHYHMYGVNPGILKVKAVDVETGEELLLFKRGLDASLSENKWFHKSLQIPEYDHGFQLKIYGSRGYRHWGDMAIDDIWLSPECFGLGVLKNKSIVIPTGSVPGDTGPFREYKFGVCNNVGRLGPTQAQCEGVYEEVNVLVDTDRVPGAQMWIVPKTGKYRLKAAGASSGSVAGHTASSGAETSATFTLHQGEQVHMVVGQQGSQACLKNGKNRTLCNINNEDALKHWAIGGGGATYIYKVNKETKKIVPLLVAGGAGSCHGNTGHRGNSNGKGLPSGLGANGVSPYPGTGSGGGMRSNMKNTLGGQSLLDGSLGGKGCHSGGGYGGFGGGGGSCDIYGAGGGGYTGGNVNQQCGNGGTSFVATDGKDVKVLPGGNTEVNGYSSIQMLPACPCERDCFHYNNISLAFICGCPTGYILHDDMVQCHPVIPTVGASTKHEPRLVLGHYLAIGAGALVLLAVSILGIICLVNQHRLNRHALAEDNKMLNPRPSLVDRQLHLVRQNSMNNNTVTQGSNLLSEFNPHYDFGGITFNIKDLREVNRSHLTLVKGLGQGAFGEVYMGHLSNVARETCHMSVAVKTLPALCTDQAETDFLMEAIIMSKFHHPNIVRFIGVCFEQHPRFIVLELLNGGDLKTFLRESRSKPEELCKLTVGDLLKLSLDIAKGCEYLEDNHFIHRDIAARNCLLTSKDSDRVAKIADFGMARDIYRNDYYRKGGKAMLPVKWMPPEAFLDGIFTSKTDIWSYGVLLWEVFSLGYMPYPGSGNQEVMQLVTGGGRMDPPKGCPNAIFEIMSDCWNGLPESRPSFKTIIQRLHDCLQDQNACNMLVIQSHYVNADREDIVMRPHDGDQVVLTVYNHQAYNDYLEPSSDQPLLSRAADDVTIMKTPNTLPRMNLTSTPKTSSTDDLPPPQFLPPPPPNMGHDSPKTPDSGHGNPEESPLLDQQSKKSKGKRGSKKRHDNVFNFQFGEKQLERPLTNKSKTYKDPSLLDGVAQKRHRGHFGRLNSSEGAQSNTSDLCESDMSSLSTTPSSLSSMDETVIYNNGYGSHMKHQSVSDSDLSRIQLQSLNSLDNHHRPWSHDPSANHGTIIEMSSMKRDKQRSGDSGVVVSNGQNKDDIIAWI